MFQNHCHIIVVADLILVKSAEYILCFEWHETCIYSSQICSTYNVFVVCILLLFSCLSANMGKSA